MTTGRWRSLWIVLALLTLGIALSLAAGLAGPWYLNLFTIFGFAILYRWTHIAWARWREQASGTSGP